MKIICRCGNEFDFGDPETTPEGGDVEGFEFYTEDTKNGNEALLLRCMRCDETIVLFGEDCDE